MITKIRLQTEIDGTIEISVPDNHIVGQFAVHHPFVESLHSKKKYFDSSLYTVTHIPSGLCTPNYSDTLEEALSLATTLSQVDKSILNRAVKGDKKAYKELSRIYKEWLEG